MPENDIVSNDVLSYSEQDVHTNVYSNELTVCNDYIPLVEMKFADLHRVDVQIKGVKCSFKCLEDSGAHIGIVRSDVISNIHVKHVGTV
jgi:hypothetical protein